MPRRKPVEGVHYVRDWYGFLNEIMEDGKHDLRLSPESPREEIELAIKRARSLNHPDRQAQAGESRRLDAEQTTKMIAECETYLLNSERKALYDEKLNAFRADKKPIVTHQGAAFGPFSSYFDVTNLLSDEEPDIPEIDAHAKILSGYDEEKIKTAQTLFETMPENPQVRTLYRDALSAKLLYLGEKERMAWEKVGWVNIPLENRISGYLTEVENYTDQVEDALQTMAEKDIFFALEERGAAARIGMTTMPRLLTAGKLSPVAEPEQEQTQALMHLVEMEKLVGALSIQAQQTLQTRSHYVREIAEQKQAVLEALLPLNPVEHLNVKNLLQPQYDIYLVMKDGRLLLRLIMDVSTGKAQQTQLPEGVETVDTLSELVPASELNVVVIIHNEAIDLMESFVELTYVANAFLETMGKLFEAKPPAATPGDKIDDGP